MRVLLANQGNRNAHKAVLKGYIRGKSLTFEEIIGLTDKMPIRHREGGDARCGIEER